MPAALATTVGSVALPGAVMTASGTGGHGAELARYFHLAELGAVVVKSLSKEPWPGNAAPRVHETTAGMLNSVGLQGPGVDAWLVHELPELVVTGARIVASVWGRSPDDVAGAVAELASTPPAVVAVEVNLSCPNTESRPFSHAADRSAAVITAAAAESAGRPLWAKLSADVADLPSIAEAVLAAGAEAVTVTNTLRAMAIDPVTRRPRLGGVTGGLSGPAVHPVAVRAVHEVRASLGAVPIVGVGGVTNGSEAVELLLAGACAVQVGTATFADPRSPLRVQRELHQWCVAQGVTDLTELIGGAHGRP